MDSRRQRIALAREKKLLIHAAAQAQRAVDYLVKRQKDDGSWDEQPFTGTGFPKVFYLKYHLYRHYFPLYALARYRRALDDRYRPGRLS